MRSKEIIKNKIASLEDDYQHYTMVDKDKFKAHFIKIDIDEHQQILQDLDRLEELEKTQDTEINNLKFIESPNKYQTSIKMLKEAFIELGKSDITNTCWFRYLEELEKENQELKKPKFDLSLLDNAKKIEVYYNEKLLEKIQDLEADIDGWKTVAEDYEKHLKNYRKENIELRYVINAIKDKGDFRLEKETNGEFTYYAMVIDSFYIPIPIETYNLLKEVISNGE